MFFKNKFLVLSILLLLHTISSAQSIGIGTSTPDASAQLDVSSTTKGMLTPRMTFVQRNAITTPAAGLIVYQTDLVSGFYYYNGAAWTQLNTGNNANYFTASGNNIYNNNTANVGIGISNPADKFHVKGGVRIEPSGNFGGASLDVYAASTSDGSFISFYNEFGATNSSAAIGYDGGSEYLLLSRGTANVFLKNTGLGISNANPLTKLHVSNGQDAGFGASSNGFMMNGLVTGPNLIIDDNELLVRNNGRKADLYLQRDSGNLILCGQEQGAVGIGVSSGTSIPAGYLLAVDGKILSEEVKVQLSQDWPDYVFDEKYQLLSLDGLRKYIAANKHLPNIPSAAEVQKNGIELGDMQKRMMEKIEELTLYIIQLEERQIQLQQQLQQLKTSINKQ